MRLVPDAHNALRWWSIRIAALGATLEAFSAAAAAGWIAIPRELQVQTPDWFQHAVAAGIFVGVMAGRLVKQKGLDDDRDSADPPREEA